MTVMCFILILSLPYPSLNNFKEKNVCCKLNVVTYFPVFAGKPIGQIQ
jgi:hypothetical protein